MKKEDPHRINEHITSPVVRLVGDNVETGIYQLRDALAKAENVEVTDQEVTQTLYYEAMMQGQDGQALIKQYEEAGYLPAIKMSMIEQKVINKLLDEKAAQ